jgi:hypothetical protein
MLTDTEEFLRLAREQYELDRQADADDRKDAEADNVFAHASDSDLAQWDKKAKAARKKRPIIQWNRILNFVHQVTNDGRQNKPAIKINRGDEVSTAHTAEFFTARIRQIEYESNVDTAKDMARDQQVITGRGGLRVSTEWIPGTQKQRIRVDKIENQFSIVWDRSARKYDRSDADRCFLISMISRAEHIRRFGEKSVLASMDFVPQDSSLQNWCGIGKDGEEIQIAEYWCKEYKEQTVPAADGQQARTEKVPVIKQYIIDGAQILDETTWLGSTIPIIPYWGEESVVDGKRRTRSLHRDARDPQRSLNLAISNLFEQLGQQSKSPWMVPAGGIAANHENDWANVHVTPLGYLVYQQYDASGRALNQPTRNQWEPAIQALLETANFCIDGIKSAMGIFDASLGAQSNETAGIAIQRRQKQTQISNFHFPDNEARSNKYLGEVLVELIGKIDRPGSSVPIRTEDGKTHIVPIGQVHADWKTGEMVSHDLMSGQYGVTVSTGPGYQAARQEGYDRDAQLIQAQPELIWVIGDQLFANDDTPGAEERADRMKRAIQMRSPGLIEDKTQQGPDPQAVQQQMAQMQQKLQTTEAFAQSLHEQLQTKQLELQTQIRLKQMDLEFQREKLAKDDENKKLDIASKESIEQLQHDIAILMDERQKNHDAQQAELDRQHQMVTQQADQVHQADQQMQAQQHQAQQSDADRQAAAEQAETAQQQQGEVEQPSEEQEPA